MKPDRGWQRSGKIAQYCYTECTSIQSPRDAKKSREIMKGGRKP